MFGFLKFVAAVAAIAFVVIASQTAAHAGGCGKNCGNWGKKQPRMLSVRYCIDYRKYISGRKFVRISCAKAPRNNAGQVCFVASNGKVFFDYRKWHGKIVVAEGQRFFRNSNGEPDWPHLD